MKDNPLLRGAIKWVDKLVTTGHKLEDYQKHTGDWSENNKDPEARADALYNLAYICNYIDSLNTPTKETDQKLPTFNASKVWSESLSNGNKHTLLKITLEDGYKSLPPTLTL